MTMITGGPAHTRTVGSKVFRLVQSLTRSEAGLCGYLLAGSPPPTSMPMAGCFPRRHGRILLA